MLSSPLARPLVEEVTAVEELEGYDIGLSRSPLGSGGMRSKVVAAEMAAAAGIPTVIGSGLVPGVLARAWAGEDAGTRFLRQPVRHSSFKLWLKSGAVIKYHLKLEGVLASRWKKTSVQLNSTTTLKDVGTTQVYIPDEARGKLGIAMPN